jgi:hypothetical protein
MRLSHGGRTDRGHGCPPLLGQLTINALAAAGELLVPVEPSAGRQTSTPGSAPPDRLAPRVALPLRSATGPRPRSTQPEAPGRRGSRLGRELARPPPPSFAATEPLTHTGQRAPS